MVITVRTSAINVVLFGALACGPRPGDDGTGSPGTSSDAATGETGVPTSGDPSALTGGQSTSTGSDSETGTCEAGSGTDPGCPTPVDECSLEHQVCVLGLTKFVEDCGVVEITDGLAKWQAAHDCAMVAASEQRTFKLIADQFGFDSVQTDAYLAEDACPYVITKVHFDEDPCGGDGCGPTVSLSSCAALTTEPGCTVEPGAICLRCGLPGESTQLCGP